MRWWPLILSVAVFITSAAAAHYLVLDQIPKRAIGTVMDRIAGPEGAGLNTLRAGAPVKPESRRVVRPSPDLIYSICVYDVSEGPVELTMVPSVGYHSLSLYDARTNNFFVVNDRSLDGKTVRVTVSGTKKPAHAPGDLTVARFQVISPTHRGVALIRRLATPDDVLSNALEARKADDCQALKR